MKRKCCDTDKGGGAHAPGCPNANQPAPSLRAAMRGVTKEGRKDAFLAMAEDLPDGAFWAMADEFGLEPDDFCD